MKKRMKKKKHWVHIISSISKDADNVENTATNLVIGDVLKIKMKKRKMKRKLNIKKSLKEYTTTVDRAIIKELKKQKEPLTVMEMHWCCVL